MGTLNATVPHTLVRSGSMTASWTSRVQPGRLGIVTRALMRVRRGSQLARDVVRFAGDQRLWWIIPFLVALALVALVITTAHSAVPVVIYTLV